MNTHAPSFVSACLLSSFAALIGCGGGGPPSGPHAYGALSIGESHPSTGGSATASVGTGFAPDADGPGGVAPECVFEVAGCTLAMQPDCGGTCGVDERCTFAHDCGSVCERICDATCGPTEECYFPTPDSPACRARQSFDAGAITISGTTTPVTLFPPYSFDGVEDGSLFIDGADLTVTAAGAATAGYAPFTESFTATSLMRSSPPLHQLGVVDVFGSGDIPVSWVAGSDDVEITASVTAKDGHIGGLTCKADDGAGHFDVPREAIDAALEGGVLDQVAITIRRSKTRMVYGLETTGDLPGEVIQPTGWLELATVSTESASFEGCADGEQVCGDACIDTASDARNCGACNHTCPTGDGCLSSTCSGPASCNSCVGNGTAGGTCSAALSACTGDAACSALRTCIAGCADNACVQTCVNNNSAGLDLYRAWVTCICDDACTLECASAC